MTKKNGRVLIEILEGDRAGEVDWVSASKLLTTSESRKQEAENIGTGIGLTLRLLCTLADSCPDNKNEPPKEKTALAKNGLDRPFAVRNKCNKPVNLWLAYYKDSKFLGDNVFWTINPQKTATLNSKSGAVLLADNSKFFYFAESTDKKTIWKGSNSINLEGKKNS